SERERLAQRLARALGAERDDDHLTTVLLHLAQRLLERALVALVDHEREIFLVDPATVLGDAQARLGVGNLLDANRDPHRATLLRADYSWRSGAAGSWIFRKL